MRSKAINILFIIVVFALGAGSMYYFSSKYKFDAETGVIENRNVTITDNSGISEAVNKIYNSVVMIKLYKNDTYYGSGSGFVYKVDNKYGYILTNYHVVENAKKVVVHYSDESEIEAKVLGGDKYLDVAVVRVDKNSVLEVAELGSSSDLKLGDTIFAVGSPIGEEYFNTITRGIVSGLDRKITVSVESNSDWVMKAIQVDTAINSGNSGGPLVNSNGQVVGITSMKLVDNSIENMGFCIKIEDAMAYISTFEKGESIERPLLGITLVNVSDKGYLKMYGIDVDDSIEYGVVVMSVIKDSGAANSGLQKGDVITMIGQEKIENQAYLKYVLYSYKVGDKIKVTYIRDGKIKTTEVTLTKNNG